MASQKGPTAWGISTLYFYCYSCLSKAQLGTNSHLVPGVKTRGIWHKTAPNFHTRALHCSGLAPASPLSCHAVVLGLVSLQLSPDSTRQPFLCQTGERDDRVMGSTSMLHCHRTPAVASDKDHPFQVVFYEVNRAMFLQEVKRFIWNLQVCLHRLLSSIIAWLVSMFYFKIMLGKKESKAATSFRSKVHKHIFNFDWKDSSRLQFYYPCA